MRSELFIWSGISPASVENIAVARLGVIRSKTNVNSIENKFQYFANFSYCINEAIRNLYIG
jgi:hypothetical protein